MTCPLSLYLFFHSPSISFPLQYFLLIPLPSPFSFLPICPLLSSLPFFSFIFFPFLVSPHIPFGTYSSLSNFNLLPSTVCRLLSSTPLPPYLPSFSFPFSLPSFSSIYPPPVFFSSSLSHPLSQVGWSITCRRLHCREIYLGHLIKHHIS